MLKNDLRMMAGGLFAGFVLAYGACAQTQSQPSVGPALWKLANDAAGVHRFSTLFTAHDVREGLSTEAKRRAAIDWCKATGVTKVYVEVFRDNYQAERDTIEKAKAAFREAGLEVGGCVTPTSIGKASTGWRIVSCYTDPDTQENVGAIFEYAAALFDEIMIDDFWFTDCTCSECDAARKSRTVTIGSRKYPVGGNGWEDYRCELMVQLSRERVLAPAKRVNPKARLIIKYPQWYDDFHVKGYDVARETSDFDWTWVGTETRDYKSSEWGGTPPYAAHFIMRWLAGIDRAKCGGGWYDSIGTTEHTYIEQARQTILGGARESMLFAYGLLQNEPGRRDILVLRKHIPELLDAARNVHSRKVIGLAAYKPAGSPALGEKFIFGFVGMLGLPLVPCHEFPTNAPAAFFSTHALKDAGFVSKLEAFVKAGKPVLLTDTLAQELTNRMHLDMASVRILPVKQKPASLLALGQEELDGLRPSLLAPFKAAFRAPNSVGLYLFDDGSYVIENFNDSGAQVELNGKKMTVPARGWSCEWR